MSETTMLSPASPETQTQDTVSWAEACQRLIEFSDCDILFDTDATWFDLRTQQIRSGTAELFETLVAQGNRVHVWSLLGDQYALEQLQAHNLENLVASTHRKPLPHQFSAPEVVTGLGFVPAITIDNEAEDQIDGIELIHVEPFIPRYGKF